MTIFAYLKEQVQSRLPTRVLSKKLVFELYFFQLATSDFYKVKREIFRAYSAVLVLNKQT